MPDHNLSINYILKLAFFLFGIINTDGGCGIFTYWDNVRVWERAGVNAEVCYYKACTYARDCEFYKLLLRFVRSAKEIMDGLECVRNYEW